MFKKGMITLAFKLLDMFLISKINYAPARAYFKAAQNNYADLVKALIDKNPQNKEQIAVYWENNKAEIIDEHLDFVEDVVEEEFDDAIEEQALMALTELRKVLEVPDND